MSFLTPAEIAKAVAASAGRKAEMPVRNLVVLGILAGVYIGFGANLAIMVGHDIPAFLGNGLGQLMFGAVFSVGLMLVVIGGAELFTGNNMFMAVGALHGTISWADLAKNWLIVFGANLVGAILLVCLVVGGFYGTGADGAASVGLFKGAVGAKSLLIAKGKLELTWSAAFCRAILCNWLVCMAVWLAIASKDITGKIFAIFFPIMAFVASGFEHSVANMFFIPLGIEVSHIPAIADTAAKSILTSAQLNVHNAGGPLPPDAVAALEAFKAQAAQILTWRNFILNNLVPVTLGNIVGGSFFVGTLYWMAYLKKDKEMPVKDNVTFLN